MSASREQAGPQPPKPTRPWTDPLQRTVDRLRVSPVDTDVNSIELDSLSVRSAKASRGSEESDVAMDDARVSAGSGSAESKGAAMPSDSEGVSSNEKSTGEDWIRQLDEDVEANNRTDHDMDREGGVPLRLLPFYVCHSSIYSSRCASPVSTCCLVSYAMTVF